MVAASTIPNITSGIRVRSWSPFIERGERLKFHLVVRVRLSTIAWCAGLAKI
jgi:hypothetical protein